MSIGPSPTARDRTTTTGHTTEASPESTTTLLVTASTDQAPADDRSFALRYAKRTFEPTNTAPTPRMFADKWTVDE